VEKVALMPRDVTWSRYVDAWLDRARRTGVLGRAFDQAP
jgi:hypothetical protein